MSETSTIKRDSEIEVSEARKGFADLISRVAFGGDRVLLSRNGKRVAALISIEQLAFFEKLEREYEVALATKSIADTTKRWTMDEVRKKLSP